MPKSTFILIIIFVLIITSCHIGLAKFDFYIGEQQVVLPMPLISDEGNVLFPASIGERYMAARLKFEPNSQQIAIEFPTIHILMRIGTKEAFVNGEQQTMNAAPRLKEGEIMIPLRFIADVLGFDMQFITDSAGRDALKVYISQELAQLAEANDNFIIDNLPIPEFPKQPDLDFTEPAVSQIEFIGGSRSQVFISVQGYTAYRSSLLTDPDRLMIDITGVKWDQIQKQIVDDLLVHSIRSAQHDENTVRIVLDLNRATNYRILPNPEGLNIFLNYILEDIGYYRDEEDVPRLWFVANEQPTIQTQWLPSPPRLIFDFQDSTLLEGIIDLTVTDPLVEQIRIRQFNPSTARVVLDLKEGASLAAAYGEINNERYEIVLFEGTEQEYQTILGQKKAETIEPKAIIPEVDPSNKSQPLYGRIIVVDPGHGGSDPGTIGHHLGLFEKDIALEIGLKLGQFLTNAGAAVVYTRTDDTYVSQFDRPKIADYVNAELLVSIHLNSYEGTEARGIETLFNPLYLENFRLAQTIQSELIASTKAPDRGVRPRTDLAVLNGAKMPAVLVEVGFISHKEEEELLNTKAYQKQIANALAEGIEYFFLTYR